ncbi:MAG: T9SS type A sorting domain-containing protein, partial [Mameliella sp.]|nr:T9SS type A sorting domain-containing protein [Phaeodactylibacter sp.]
PAIEGAFRPGSPLSALTGEVAAGEWQLILFDNFSQDGGQLKNWELEVCATYPSIPEVFLDSEILEACTDQIMTFEIFVGTGFNQPVTLGIAGLPDGVSGTFEPEIAPPGTFATLTLDSMYAVTENDIIVYGGDGSTIHFCELELHIGTPPNTPILFAPADASPVFQGEQSFSWSPSVGADSFLLEISTDTTFLDPVFSSILPEPYLSLTPELDAGSYFWRVSAINRCGANESSVFSFVKEGVPTATTGIQPSNTTQVFPNPTSGRLNINLPTGEHTASTKLYNTHGQLLKEKVIGASGTMDLTGLPSGLYWLHLAIGDRLEVHKVVLQ